MASIPEETIARIRSRAQIADVVGRFVKLKRTGRSYKGLCPFHSERTPSFSVDPEKQLYHCFGCGKGGDVFSFLMEIEGKPFPEVVRDLGRLTGVEVPEPGADDPEARRRQRDREALLRANAEAARIYQSRLADPSLGRPAVEHLRGRGIEGRTARAFGLGYAPLGGAGLLRALQAAGVGAEVAERAGLLGRGERGLYERFRGRLMVPIRRPDGTIVAFGGRRVEGEHPAKYINSPETPLYHKSEVLFGLDRAREGIRRTGRAVIVEGYFDVIALHQAGVTEAVATCGTALTEGHVRLLSRYTRDLYLVFDGDAAGLRAAERSQEVLEGFPAVVARVVVLPEGSDPDTFVRSAGREAFERCLEEARTLTEFLLERALAQVGHAVEEKVRAADQLAPILRRVRDPMRRRLYVQQVAERLGMETAELWRRIGGEGRRSAGHGRATAPAQPRTPAIPASEEALCLLALEHPHVLEEVEAVLESLSHPEVRAALEVLLAAWKDRGAVDVHEAMARISDAETIARWREHLARSAERLESSIEPARAVEYARTYAQKIHLAAIDREEARLRRRLALEGVPAEERARKLQALKERKRQITQARPLGG